MESYPSKPRLILPRLGERRKTTFLKGPPFIDDEGLVLIDRRSNQERRGQLRNPTGSDQKVCALLRFRARTPGGKK